MPDEDAGHNRGHKYPFLSCEIFNCEINQILDKFFEAPPRPPVKAPQPDKDGESKDDEDKDSNSKAES
jgi:hypothetical protein